MIVAGFHDQAALLAAVGRLRLEGLAVETRTPVALPEDEHGPSRIPAAVLGAALLGFAAAFGMQCYATIISYPQLIGGRPGFFWTSYAVWAVEFGVLAATATAFFGFLVANRLPRFWEPSDECDALREAMRDGWFLVAHGEAAYAILAQCAPASLERVSLEHVVA